MKKILLALLSISFLYLSLPLGVNAQAIQCRLVLVPTILDMGQEGAFQLGCSGTNPNFYVRIFNSQQDVVQSYTVFQEYAGQNQTVAIQGFSTPGNYQVVVFSEPNNPSSQITSAGLSVREDEDPTNPTPPPGGTGGIICGITAVDETFVCPAQCPIKNTAPGTVGGSLVCVVGLPGYICKTNASQAGTDYDGIKTAFGCIPVVDINGFISFALIRSASIAGGVAMILIIIACLQIIMSRGDPERLQGGKELLTAAVVGLIFLIFSVFAYQFIAQNVLKIL